MNTTLAIPASRYFGDQTMTRPENPSIRESRFSALKRHTLVPFFGVEDHLESG
jgi:hypothetical protein